jgi:hypothetical protein
MPCANAEATGEGNGDGSVDEQAGPPIGPGAAGGFTVPGELHPTETMQIAKKAIETNGRRACISGTFGATGRYARRSGLILLLPAPYRRIRARRSYVRVRHLTATKPRVVSSI